MAECPELPVTNRNLSLTLPGGLSLSVQYPGADPPTQLQLALQMMGQVSAATAPFAPIFNLVNLGLSTVEFAKAVPQVVVNPPAVAEAIANLIDAAAKTAQIVPALSVPSLVGGMIDVLLTFLGGVLEELQKHADFMTRIASAQAVADSTGNQTLVDSIACAEAVLASQQANLSEAMSSAGGFITMINSIGSIIGLPSVEDLGDLGDDPTDAIEAMQDVVKIIQGVRSVLPI